MSDPAAAPREFIAAYNDRAWERLEAVLTPGCVYEEIRRPKRRVEGAGEVVGVFQGWAKTVPDARVNIVNVIAAGDGVALELELLGALQGPFGDYSPTGKRPAAFSALIFVLDGDLIREFRHYYDSLVLYHVLGIGP